MADKKNKYTQNVSGCYYVDKECICCDACTLAAPDFFILDEEEGHAYVVKQPQSQEDRDACEEALEACPVEAIGSDGEILKAK